MFKKVTDHIVVQVGHLYQSCATVETGKAGRSRQSFWEMFKFHPMPRDRRVKRDLHALNEDGRVMCNPRDKEATLRSQTEEIATDDWDAVTCCKCLKLVFKHRKLLIEKKKKNLE